MAVSMVTARIPDTKKEAGNRVLAKLGTTASSAINDLYDYVIAHEKLPWQEANSKEAIAAEELTEALIWIDGLQVELPEEFANMTTKQAKARRIGIASPSQTKDAR